MCSTMGMAEAIAMIMIVTANSFAMLSHLTSESFCLLCSHAEPDCTDPGSAAIVDIAISLCR